MRQNKWNLSKKETPKSITQHQTFAKLKENMHYEKGKKKVKFSLHFKAHATWRCECSIEWVRLWNKQGNLK